ncbi:hypothetical protein V5799_026079 [Amblyomma americanum]|uniref:Uncharacterized protein n=1 Tax=Amblyomma americanum TaxID=6943 RepID=A0AAQ4DJM0_AMBAM
MITFGLILTLASAAIATHVSVHAVPVASVATTYHHAVVPAPYVAAAVPPVSTTYHHAPAVSKASRVTSFQTVHPGVPHTVAKVSTYTPAATAVHTVHSSVPTAVVGAVHHVPAYGYLPHYTHRVDAHPYVYGLSPYGFNYGYGVKDITHLCLVIGLASAAIAGNVAIHGVPVASVATTYHHHAVVPAPYVAAAALPAVSTAYHHAPAVSKATRVTSFETVRPGVPHTLAKVSTYSPAAATVHTVHSSVPTAVVGAVHPVHAYTYLPRYSHRYDAHPLRYRHVYGLTPYGLNYGYGLASLGYVIPIKKCEVWSLHDSC